jgi:MYXO-CTERM domain-containing protein
MHPRLFIALTSIAALGAPASARAGVPGATPTSARVAAAAAATSLPASAAQPVTVRARDGFHVGFRLLDALDVAPDASGRFRGAVALGDDRFDLTFQAIEGGLEDFVHFPSRPAREALIYEVDVSEAAGLRLVGGVLELLDPAGAPRLRMRAPYVIDASGARRGARVVVTGCAYDASPAAPWGRPVTAPGAAACQVEIRWGAAIGEPVAYPAVLDPAWVDGGTLVYPRNAHVAVRLADGKVLVAGGYIAIGTSSYTDVAEIFDPDTATWAATDSMTRPRAHFGGVVFPAGALAGQALFAAGDDQLEASADLYDPVSGTWSATAPMKKPRDGGLLVLLADGTALAAGGCSAYSSTCDTLEASAEVYDPALDTWTLTATPMHNARTQFSMTALPSGGAVAIGGCKGYSPGFICNTSSSTADLYDPVTRGWTASPMGASMQNHAATLLCTDVACPGVDPAVGAVLVSAGTSNGTFSHQTLLFDPATSAFTATGATLFDHDDSDMAVAPSGKALYAGSWGTQQDFSAITKQVELYDPALGAWAATTPMATPHGNESVTALADGRVLIAGGFNQPSPGQLGESPLGEIFDETLEGSGGAGGGGSSTSVTTTGPSTATTTGVGVGPSVTASSASGAGGHGAGTGSGAGGGAEDTAGASDSGCGCRTTGGGETPAGAAAIGLAALLLLRRARRRGGA